MLDTTKLVLDILSDALDVHVTTKMPKDVAHPDPQRMVLVDLEGDQSTPFLLLPRYGLTCWGLTDRDAHGIAVAAVCALQDAALDHPYLSACDLESMSRDEWSRSGQSRYLATVDLTINTDE